MASSGFDRALGPNQPDEDIGLHPLQTFSELSALGLRLAARAFRLEVT